MVNGLATYAGPNVGKFVYDAQQRGYKVSKSLQRKLSRKAAKVLGPKYNAEGFIPNFVTDKREGYGRSPSERLSSFNRTGSTTLGNTTPKNYFSSPLGSSGQTSTSSSQPVANKPAAPKYARYTGDFNPPSSKPAALNKPVASPPPSRLTSGLGGSFQATRQIYERRRAERKAAQPNATPRPRSILTTAQLVKNSPKEQARRQMKADYLSAKKGMSQQPQVPGRYQPTLTGQMQSVSRKDIFKNITQDRINAGKVGGA
jgi:hypothetical protein